MWNEVNHQNDGTILRNADRSAPFSRSAEEWVVSGPHCFVANPFNKTPRAICAANGHYDVLNLETLSDNYLPRTNFSPMADLAEYERRIPLVLWSESESVLVPWNDLTAEEKALYTGQRRHGCHSSALAAEKGHGILPFSLS